jgi:hypothetical protein
MASPAGEAVPDSLVAESLSQPFSQGKEADYDNLDEVRKLLP